MSNPSDYFLDACVAMYAGGRDHPYRDSCAHIIIAVGEGSLQAVTDAEAIQEIAYRLTAVGRRAEGLRMAQEFVDTVGDVLPVTREDAIRSLDLLRTYPLLPPRDAIHVAVMQTAGLNRIITADRHFDKVRGIERVDPTEMRW